MEKCLKNNTQTVLPFDLRKAVQKFEAGYIHNILQHNQGDKKQTADMLGLKIYELEEKIKFYEINTAR